MNLSQCIPSLNEFLQCGREPAGRGRGRGASQRHAQRGRHRERHAATRRDAPAQARRARRTAQAAATAAQRAGARAKELGGRVVSQSQQALIALLLQPELVHQQTKGKDVHLGLRVRE